MENKKIICSAVPLLHNIKLFRKCATYCLFLKHEALIYVYKQISCISVHVFACVVILVLLQYYFDKKKRLDSYIYLFAVFYVSITCQNKRLLWFKNYALWCLSLLWILVIPFKNYPTYKNRTYEHVRPSKMFPTYRNTQF